MKYTAIYLIWLFLMDFNILVKSSSAIISEQKWTKHAKKLQAKGGLIDKAGHRHEYVSSANPDLKVLAFDEDYDFNLPPPPMVAGKPVDVNVSLNLRNILQVNEITQIVTMEVSIRMYWMDDRVRLSNYTNFPEGEDYITLNPRLARHLWIPDIFIDQAKELREPTFHVLPASLRVYKNSLLRYAARVNFDVACNMDFRAYPGDRQVCDIKFESFGYSTKQLSFRWLNSSHVNENISLSQFDLIVSMNNQYDTDYYDVKYPGLILKLVMIRKLNYHLVQTYIPSGVYLTVSWLALFVPPQSIAERLAMAMTIMLTLTAMFASERQSVPRVSYITHLDIWMLACILFVFIELAEFTVVLHLERTQKTRLAPIIENIAKILLPLLFILFNIVYWYFVINQRFNDDDYEGMINYSK